MNDTATEGVRYAALDAARGVAIVLMIIYHFSWDLTYFKIASFGIFTDPWWIWFARIIVIIILGVMGISQVMARRRPLDARIFFRRFGLIAASALAVSLTTYWMDPGSYVYFGILHHIALAAVIIAGAIVLPSAALVVLAAAILAAPGYLAHPAFSADWLLWLGLSPETPFSVDYVPLVPWFAAPLLGIVAGRWIFQSAAAQAALAWQPAHPAAIILRLAGRHSLAIYLLHQPLLYGGLYLFVNVIGH